ncbi:MAG TPA: hypothetical protein VFO57_05775, partial [Burkholderiales bacterium]|nr:hypothetical protein [Burkholderiales bacterium]
MSGRQSADFVRGNPANCINSMTTPFARAWLLAIFTVSGFSGLIYESIWSHYLKLFLGHAAYAQALVLAIFMGGMALGAWICSLKSDRWPHVLLIYAGVESVLGLLAFLFHPVFLASTEFGYDTAMPALSGSPLAVSAFKWTLAALLILPQSTLLGMTFPLMSAGILRAHPDRQGETISMLYFTNSLGAAAGVLASGFFLVRAVGLPGTMLTAGLLNCGIALAVWLIGRNSPQSVMPRTDERSPNAARPARLLLMVSLLTGAASFMYEVGWIRMLSMVLSSSTHAFELMLSAFILGLAFGGLWLRRRIDAIRFPETFLGGVQIAMGLLALATLLVYERTFELMHILLDTVARNGPGYTAFNFGSHLIALLIMFPAAFCAGMTLPLITSTLLRSGSGERAIGAVYAANTVGAIVGVFVAVHFAMPILGLKGLITLGAAIDIALGLVLLWRYALTPIALRGAAALGACAIVATLAWVELDSLKMASGVYRHGGVTPQGQAEVLFHRDGKTATVNLLRAGGKLSITTNGKSDAMIDLSPQAPASDDEPVMILTGALPLALHPDARTAAVIGIGSGISSHVLLSSSTLRAVDTIEIEPAMVEAARGFGSRNDLVFSDPRSRIYIEDAKIHFSTHGKRYDIIVSEPSNPWVSGVASLFTDEFYQRMTRHLEKDGLFVQWIQLYEIDTRLVASIIKALARNFSHYEVYTADDHNLIIAARRDLPLPPPSDAVFQQARLAAELERLDVRNAADLDVFRLGSERVLQPFFNRYPIAPNSDFFPVLDQNAAKARFLGAWAREIIDLGNMPIPAIEFLGGVPRRATPVAPRTWLRRSELTHAAQQGRDFLLSGATHHLEGLPVPLRSDFALTRLALRECHPNLHGVSIDQLFAVAGALIPQLPRDAGNSVWEALKASRCTRGPQARLITLFSAIDARNGEAMAHIAESELRSGDPAMKRRRDFFLAAAIVGRLSNGDRARAAALWNEFADGMTSERGNILP